MKCSVLTGALGTIGDRFVMEAYKPHAQMIGASIDNLCVRASDGNYYSIDVDRSGNVTGTLATVTEEEIDARQTDSGRVILETSITASDINTSNLLGTLSTDESNTSGLCFVNHPALGH